MQVKVASGTSSTYEPTQIPKEKYSKIVEGRNRFFIYSIGAVATFMVVSSMPQMMINRAVRSVYRRHCHGKVLDMSPKLYDEKDVALYEMSKAVRVEYLVQKKVVDDGHYKIDEMLSEAEKDERRRAMTLDYMIRNDHHWVGSPVTFAIEEIAATAKPGFRKYDAVVIRDDLMNHKSADARALFDSAAQYMDDKGRLLVMDFGKSSLPSLDKMARWFNDRTNSSMCLTHDYRNWIEESMLYEIEEERRALLGFYYTLVLKKR